MLAIQDFDILNLFFKNRNKKKIGIKNILKEKFQVLQKFLWEKLIKL